MGTFFVRCTLLALLLTGCSRRSAAPIQGGLPAPRADTINIAVPVIRVTPADAPGAVQLDSATLRLFERRVLSRASSILRAHAEIAAGVPTSGVPQGNGGAPEIRHGLLGTITFDDDGTISPASRTRLVAIARLLTELESPLEIRSTAQLGGGQMDIAIARARRVYVELVTQNRKLAERDVALTINGTSLHGSNPHVEIFWRNDTQP